MWIKNLKNTLDYYNAGLADDIVWKDSRNLINLKKNDIYLYTWLICHNNC